MDFLGAALGISIYFTTLNTSLTISIVRQIFLLLNKQIVDSFIGRDVTIFVRNDKVDCI